MTPLGEGEVAIVPWSSDGRVAVGARLGVSLGVRQCDGRRCGPSSLLLLDKQTGKPLSQ